MLRLCGLEAIVSLDGVANDELLAMSAYDSDADALSPCVKGLTITLLSISGKAGRAASAYLLIKDLH